MLLQELEALGQKQPVKQHVQPAAPVPSVKPRTLGSTLITLGVLAGVFGLLLVPLMTK